MAANPPFRAIGYARVSTGEQANGISLDAQAERIQGYAQAKGWELVDILRDDGHSAATLDRPRMQEVLAAIRAGHVQVVIVAKLDRLTRSLRDMDALLTLFRRANVELASLSESLDTTTAGGRLMLHLLVAVSQWEREIIAERTSQALQHKKAKREVYGPTPYGWRRVGTKLEPEPAEQAVLRRTHALRRRGHSYRAIADRLNQDAVPTKTTGRWHAMTVRRVLENPRG